MYTIIYFLYPIAGEWMKIHMLWIKCELQGERMYTVNSTL